MGALRLWILVLLLPLAAAQDPADTVQPIVEGILDEGIPPAENETGQDFTSEEIDIFMDLEFVNAEYDLLGMAFGGGKVQADMEVNAQLAFFAVSAERLDDALRAASGDANASLQDFGIPSHRLALTAEEIRAVGAGSLLRAFQQQQEDASKAMIEDTVVGLTVLSSRFSWLNTRPGQALDVLDPDNLQPPSVREPPILLNIHMRMQFLERVSLGEVLYGVGDSEESPKKSLQRQIEANQTVARADRSAFHMLGFSQLLDFSVPPGWILDVQLTVPEGFTIESATDELNLADDRRSVDVALAGGNASLEDIAAVATLSNRALVTGTLFVAMLIVGFALRVMLEAGTFAWLQHQAVQSGRTLEKKGLAHRLRSFQSRAKSSPKLK